MSDTACYKAKNLFPSLYNTRRHLLQGRSRFHSKAFVLSEEDSFEGVILLLLLSFHFPYNSNSKKRKSSISARKRQKRNLYLCYLPARGICDAGKQYAILFNYSAAALVITARLRRGSL